ncbi:hypothetical protein RHMOL_Rhmol10G0087700 [Rhododendron molle]|uniref:Uncharacterized protein n=1 Tax=Rhododendron molle TaxID=49168 RepID=A0ACC0M0E3_RHOML|nr:hypothetical protein RHMOL_Rhmol10G0087700 [Rhododendron molle]
MLARNGWRISTPKPANRAINKVEDVIDAKTGQWDTQKMSMEIPVEVMHAILEIPLAHVGRTDQLVWHFNPNGCYSVKSGYHIALQNQSEKVPNTPETSFKLEKEVWKVLWKMKAPNKVKNFWWHVCRNILATKENLFKRRCAKDNLCPICDCEVETVDHMLFLCPWANMVWFGCNIKPFGDLRGNGSAVKWTDDMVKVLGTNKATEFMGRVAAIAWHIWKGRNDFVFKKGTVNPQRTVDSIRHMEREISSIHVISTVQMDNPLNQEETSTWRAPDVGRLKANCDVALPKSGKKGKAVAMLRNWKGKMMEGVARSVHIASSLGGELYAIRAACEMLLSLGLKEVEVESDNKQAIALSVSELVPPWSV